MSTAGRSFEPAQGFPAFTVEAKFGNLVEIASRDPDDAAGRAGIGGNGIVAVGTELIEAVGHD